MLIQAYDHYSTDNKDGPPCIAEFVGVLVEESSCHYVLRHIKADVKDLNSAAEYHVIMKGEVLLKYEFEIELSSN